MIYPHIQRSSPTTATAVASATVTIQNVPNNIPPFAARGSAGPQFQNQYQIGNQLDYRSDSRQSKHQQFHLPSQGNYPQNDLYNPEHPVVNDGQAYLRNQMHHGRETSNRIGRNRQTYHSNYQNQQHYYNYNNKTHGNASDAYNHNVGAHPPYNQVYQAEQSPYNHYGYQAASMYQADSTENLSNHMPNAMHVNHDASSGYYPTSEVHQMHKVNNPEYANKVNYYEGNYNSPQMTPGSESGYMTDVYPNTNTATAMVSTTIMTPPTSVQTDSSETYNNFHQFYPSENPQTQVHPTPGENSNSSSDFNFLSNLANDYTPEYYQI